MNTIDKLAEYAIEFGTWLGIEIEDHGSGSAQCCDLDGELDLA
jgi:hypothetical protein